jgi:hypothetical protein
VKPEDNADMERFARALARALEPLQGYGSAKKVLATTRSRRAPAKRATFGDQAQLL